MIKTVEHIKYMKIALKEAQKAKELDEVPIGAVIVLNGKIIAKAHNLREKNQCATAHAEVLAINKACKKLNSWRLNGCVLYVTLEPCTMCVGASILSRVDGIVFGAKDPKGGSLGSLYDISLIKGFNHYPWVVSGVCEDESAFVLKEFFKNKRKSENKQ